MKERRPNEVLDQIAKANGYGSTFELLRDYGLVPSVMTPKHRKIAFVPLFLKHTRNQKHAKR